MDTATQDTTPTPQQIEGRLLASLATIAAAWDDMLEPPARRPGQRVNGTGAALPDDADATGDTPRAVQVIDARRDVIAIMRSWCQVTVETHNVTHGIPSGQDVPGMAGFLARWSYLLAEHDAALDLLDEIETARATVEKWAPPQNERPRDWKPRPWTIRLGACPLTWQDPETADDKPCPGRLVGHEDGWITCNTCGTRAVPTWWEEKTYGEGGAPMMTAAQLVTWLHRQYGMVVQKATIRQWVTRGYLTRSGVDSEGRNLYDRAAVDQCIRLREERAG